MRYIFFGFLFYSCVCQAATTDSLIIEGWYNTALSHLEYNRIDSFDYYYSKVTKALIQQDDLYGWISKHRALGKVFLLEKEQPEQALSFLKKAYSENLFRQPKAGEEWEALGYLYILSAYINDETEGFDLAKKDYNRAKNILVDRLNINDYYVASFLLLPLSTIYTKKGDYAAAETLLKRSYQIYINEQEYADAASTLSDLSVVYIDLGHFEKAIQICNKGLAMNVSDEVALGLLNSNLAKALFAHGDLKKSLSYANEANRYFRILLNDGWAETASGWLAINKILMGEIHTALQDFTAANTNFKEAELFFDNMYENKYDRDFGKLYQAWGMSKTEEGDNEKALELFQKSLQSMLPHFKAENPVQNPSVKDLYAENTLMDALLGKAKAFDNLFDIVKNSLYLDIAIQCHELIFEVEKLLRQSYYYEDSRLFNVEESRQRCGHAISVCLKLAKEKDKSVYQQKAFEFAERSKSILLLASFLKNNSIENSVLPKELTAAEKKYLQGISTVEKKLFRLETTEPRDSGQIQTSREKLFNLKKQYADWVTDVREQYSTYYDNRYNDSTLSVDDIQKKLLKRNETMLEYFVGQSRIYLFVINIDDFEVIEMERTPGLETQVIALQQSIQQYMNSEKAKELCDTYTRLGRRFYKLLLEKVAEEALLKKNVTVIPSGILSYIQFDVLLTNDPEENCRFNNYPYSLYDHNFSYGYSAALHYRLSELPNRSKDSLLGIGPRFDGRNGWGALKANVELLEVLEQEWSGIYELNDSATIARLQKSLEQQSFEIIHFSTHAEANLDNGDFSFIVFADGKGNYDSLFVKDIYQLSLLSEMVVLGACETAVGELYDGEGVISLARAFLQTGSRSVITTLWSVYDGTNKKVLLDFYNNLRKGMSKSEALRQAKITQTRLDSRSAHPVFWAAYTPYGEMGAIRSKPSLWGYMLGGILLFFSGFLIYKKKKNTLLFQKSTNLPK